MSSSSPKPRWSARMGSVMRRTSSILTISRPGTPSIASDKELDNASLLSGTIKAQPSTALPPVITPSPIIESPLGETAAAEESVGPSSLAQVTTSAAAVQLPVPVTLPPPVDELQSPTGYFPPPILDSTVGNPGAFTDEPDELPQPDIAQDPFAAVPSIPATLPPPVVEDPTGYIPPPILDSTVGNPGAFTDEPDELPQPDIVQDPLAVASVEPEPEAVIVEALVEEPSSYLDESLPEIKPADHVDNTIASNEAVHENTLSSEPDHGQGEAAEYYRGDVILTSSEAVHENANIVLPEPEVEMRHHEDVIPVPTTEPERQEETQQQQNPIAIPIPVPLPNYELSSYPMNMSSGQEVWGDENDGYGREGPHHSYPSSVPIIIPNSEDLKRVDRSAAPSIRMPEADPFADPIAPRITVSRSELNMPQPETAEEYHQGPSETHRDIHGPIAMPLPSFHLVSHSKPIHHVPSNSSLRGKDTGRFGMAETDETLPLLSSRPVTPSKHKVTSYLQPSAHSRNILSVSPLVFSSSQSTTSNNGNANSWNPHPGSHPKLHNLGWLEYYLPDGTVYYVHPTTRVTTEINLRSERMLTGVERFLEDHGKDHPGGAGSAAEGTVAAGGEIWLRDVGTAKSGMVLERWWVDHRVRTVVLFGDDHDQQHGRKGYGKGKGKKGNAVRVEEDQLDTEYRYWSFVEAHPAHNALPSKAKIEAMDVLTWAWTERLLPSHRAVPAPFTQEECQELMTLIRSFNDDHQDDHGIQTRIVSRILLRVAHWRQTYFRPNKPLPTDVGPSPSHHPIAPRRPFRRAILDFFVSCLFLGIPYIFFERSRLLSSRTDEESGLRNATPTLVIGACTCLVAAIVLSASVTFISLPGLDPFSRTAGMVAIVFATFSMASTVVAIFRHKADLERPISNVGIEGMMVITRRTVILSLPLVFLAYSVLAVTTGIVLYSFRGVILSDPSITKTSFQDYTRWGVVGVVGVLAGMVVMSMILLR
ncbi:hypothetical protein BYT27DRAFT_6700590 [Phlegmacium glaucopus]|nr:hypothetical protein BYT27DRAFT_6700590 [Phlegmacium glaucopus]